MISHFRRKNGDPSRIWDRGGVWKACFHFFGACKFNSLLMLVPSTIIACVLLTLEKTLFGLVAVG